VTAGRSTAVRRQSIMVALAATIVVAIAYVLVSLAVVTVVTRDLTNQVDQRLAQGLSRVREGPPPTGVPPERPVGDRPFDAPMLIWTVGADGTVMADIDAPALPSDLIHTVGPQTASINGSELRLEGAQVGDRYVILGQTLTGVSDARSTILLAEVLIVPLLLLVVFLGAVVIGQRVAAPVEAARQRQLEFTADASHELRTPLSVIEANASLALTGDRDTGWYRSTFERVDRETKRMRRLLDDMLWLARFDAGRPPSGAEPVDVGVLAAQTADRFAAVAETKGVALRVHVPDGGASVAAPPDLLDRLLGVLLDNACKYVPDGGTVDVTVARDGGRVAVTVDDSGPGIPPDERERIFDRFHRANEDAANAANATGAVGAGLGLAIADAIVRATGGRWQVGESPAGGARLSVNWPRVLA
jgi:two-component system sensor histidine kinase CiaH